jgi:hypothetical protein
MITLHGLKINVGDKVWDIHHGWDVVIYLHSDLEYKIETNSDFYTSEGQYYSSDTFPTLFWNEFEVPKRAFIKPLPDLRVDTKVLVWNNGDTIKERRYFSHFYEGEMYCFTNGVSGWTTKSAITTSWDYWELYEEEK